MKIVSCSPLHCRQGNARGRKLKIKLLIKLLLIECLVILTLTFLFYNTESVYAHEANTEQTPPGQGVDDETCLACHARPDQYFTLPSGEELYITIDDDEYSHSVHGEAGYACVQCHTDIREYPHPPSSAVTRRDVTLEQNTTCTRCHSDKFDATLDSVHGEALAGGNKEAAVCSDCHGAHNVQPPDEPRSRVPQTCERCHSEIYNKYEESVHGEALLGEGNLDVPSCTDCHGVHSIEGPSNSPFHLNSPLICAECHADEELMTEYGISTNVFDTYVSDFHGKTVVLFEATAFGQETNKPVCVDCHGVHDIRSPDDPQSRVIQENIHQTCQRCHPDAPENFSNAWLGHYEPDIDKYPAVYIVDLFYKFFIPITLGGMAFFVVADFGRRTINRRREKKNDDHS